VRSLPARLPSLQHLLSDHKCSIALLSETWLLPSRALTIPQFKIYKSNECTYTDLNALLEAVQVASTAITRYAAVATQPLRHDPLGTEQQAGCGQHVERRWHVVLQHVADVHLGTAKQPLVLGVVSKALKRV